MMTTTSTRYADCFEDLSRSGRKAFIPFTLLGWPNRETSRRIVQAMIDGGASALELGIAFSDPAADGPVIQQAAQEVLQAGFRVDDAFALIREIRATNPEIPIGLLAYYNLALARGVGRFYADAAAAGADGVLMADLPPESAEEAVQAAHAAGIQPIFIVSPLTQPGRLSQIAAMAGGFLYIVSRLGITGVEARYDDSLKSLLALVKQATPLPACVGFGVSTPEQARAMLSLGADGVITGSRLIALARELPPEALEAGIRDFVRAMADVCENPPG